MFFHFILDCTEVVQCSIILQNDDRYRPITQKVLLAPGISTHLCFSHNYYGQSCGSYCTRPDKLRLQPYLTWTQFLYFWYNFPWLFPYWSKIPSIISGKILEFPDLSPDQKITLVCFPPGFPVLVGTHACLHKNYSRRNLHFEFSHV